MRTYAAASALLLVTLGASCSERRVEPTEAPVYDADIAPILARRCVSCHGSVAPAAGWDATSYISVISCVAPSGAAATLPAASSAPILRALGEAPHLTLLDPDEASLLTRWVKAGAPAFQGTVHAPGIIDPRSNDWHGALLRSKRWSQMLDAEDPEACGRCHDGTPARPKGVTSSAPGAPSCTTCHDRPDGVLACSTCHGDGARSSPPRDPCFFPADAAKAGAHAVHLAPSAALPGGLVCSACHPAPSPGTISKTHGNGVVDVAFDPALVGGEAGYDRATQTCSVGCHDQGGAHPKPRWGDNVASTCQNCHASPPAKHFPGACTTCHAEVNATGTALVGGALHMNGRVDLGDGSGGCGACHGSGDDAWPKTGAHKKHENPAISAPVECSSCHVVPKTVIAPGHLDGVVEVALSGHALDRNAVPSWDGASCSSVACHGAKLVDPPAVIPVWQDASGAASECGACHGIPPSQHSPSTACGQAICHGSEVQPDKNGLPLISMAGKVLHINGAIDH